MLNSIIRFSISNKLIITLFVLYLIGFGIYQLTQLPIDAVPDITDNQVQVITVSPSLGAPDIERLITFPIEQSMVTINGLKEIRSFSRFGLSLVTIVFEDDIDVYFARQQVSERLQQIASVIPENLGKPELAPITTGLGEIYQYVVRTKPAYSNYYSLEELREIQDWIVRRNLLGVEGVADVSSFGGKLKQYHVKLNPQKLRTYNLTINDVFEALRNNNQNIGGSYIEKGPTVLFIRSEGLIQSIEDIERIAVNYNSSGTPILIRDVGSVVIGYATRYGAMTYNDEGETVGGVLMMLKGANSNKVIENVKERIAEIQKSLPEGVFIEPFLDRTKMVNNAISTVEKNLLEGALIVVFVLVLFLGNLRAGFIVASIIPLSMLFAVIMMNFFGVTGNLMSLGALDFGLIVDGAVIIVEAVLHRFHHLTKQQLLSHSSTSGITLNQDEMDAEVEQSAGKMMNSAVFGQIIILIVYLPIFTLEGIEGKMFKPMAQTVMFALLGAFILSLTYIPMITSVLLNKQLRVSESFSDKMMNWLEHKFKRIQSTILDFKVGLIITVSVLFMLTFALLFRLGGEFIPALEEGDFAVDTRVLTGSNLNTTIEYTQKTAAILKDNFPEVIKVVTKIGSGEIPTDPMPIEASDMMVVLKPKEEWTSAKTFPELAEKMSASLQVIPGVTAGFQFPVQMRFNELMTGARQDVVCKLFGENLDSLAKYADLIGSLAETIEGAKDIYVEPITGLPQLIIRPKRSELIKYQLSINDINRIIETALAGSVAGLIYQEERRFDLVVKLQDTFKSNINDIQNLYIPIANGTQIPLKAVADVAIEVGPNQIQRENAKRRIVIGFNVRGRDVQSIVADLQQAVEKNIHLSPGYYLTYGGAFENLEAAKVRLAIAVPVALGLIFLLLYFAFGSVKKGLLVYAAIPLSAIGGILALFLRGMPFSISAGIGFIALFGVAVLNGIVLIAEFNHLKEQGETDIKQLVMKGTLTRLRPVLMTAAVASLGFLPMALSNGAGAEVQRPLATVVIGGLVVATFLTLFVLPALYMIFESNSFSEKHPLLGSIKVLIPFLLFLPNLTVAQEKITFEQFQELAQKNNPDLKIAKLEREIADLNTRTAWDIPQVQFDAEFGKFNNNKENDTRLSVIQTIPFPTQLRANSKRLQAQLAQQKVAFSISEKNTLQRGVELFYSHALLYKQTQVIQIWQQEFSANLSLIEKQYQSGRITALEYNGYQTEILALNRLFETKWAEWTRLNQEIQLFIGINEMPDLDHSQIRPEAFSDVPDKNPLATQWYQSAVSIVAAEADIQKSQWLPAIRFGVNNYTFIGMQDTDGTVYGRTDFFPAFQVGFNFPLNFQSQRSLVKQLNRKKQMAQLLLEKQSKQWSQKKEFEVEQYKRVLSQLLSVEQVHLPELNKAKEQLSLQFKNGSLSALQWIWLSKQNRESEMAYYDLVLHFIQLHASLMHYN